MARIHPTHILFSPTLRRTYAEISEDRLTMVAAGVTYYMLLASFPALAVLVGLLGLVAVPADFAGELRMLQPVLPPGALDIVERQLADLSGKEPAALSIAVIIGFLVALWSAISGVKAMFEAMNIAYDESEKRSFLGLNLLALAFTLGTMLVGLLIVFAMGIIPAALAFIHLDGFTDVLLRLAPWPVITLLVFVEVLLIYRYGPSREPLPFRHIFKGALLATLAWLITSAGFSYYLANFADYNATYGALGALIGLLVWLWLSVFIVLAGAEYNRELDPEPDGAARHA